MRTSVRINAAGSCRVPGRWPGCNGRDHRRSGRRRQHAGDRGVRFRPGRRV